MAGIILMSHRRLLPLVASLCLFFEPVAGGELIAYWPLQSGNPSWLEDAGPHQLDLVVNGATNVGVETIDPISAFPSALANGVNLASLASVNESHLRSLTAPDHPALTFTQQFTLECFVRVRALQGNANHLISQFSSTQGNQRSWALLLNATGELQLHLSSNGGSQDAIGSGIFLSFDKDYYIAVSVDLSDITPAGITFTVKNLTDDLPPNHADLPHTVTTLHDSPAGVGLGCSYNGSGNEQGFDGLLAHVRLSHKRLTREERLMLLPPRALSAPGIAPSAGKYPGMVEVKLITPIGADFLLATTDGSDPRSAGRQVVGPLYLKKDTLVRAVGMTEGVAGDESSAAYEVVPMELLGRIPTRAAADLEEAGFGIGAETLDREFANYDAYKEHLGELGATNARIQSGWARCEQSPGIYDFTWLDTIVDDMLSRGVRPWVNISYGNPIYDDGGDSSSASPLPTGVALAAWDAYVSALVDHLGDRVSEWEIWNEPNFRGISASDYATFYKRTAEVIRDRQPTARLFMGALSHSAFTQYAQNMLNALGSANSHLVDEVTYHPYNIRPEAMISSTLQLRTIVMNFDPRIGIRQGECGMPSTPNSYGFVGNLDWTELSQAKWVLRRMIVDRSLDVPTTIFSIVDLAYNSGLNSKGLLKSNLNKTVEYRKPAFAAYQHVVNLLPAQVKPAPGITIAHSEPGLFTEAFEHPNCDNPMVFIWLGNAAPDESTSRRLVAVEVADRQFTDPCYVDLLDGRVYRLPTSAWTATATETVFHGLPVWDSPIAIFDRPDIGLNAASFLQWQHWHLSEEGFPMIDRQPGQDPDGDGRSNLLEYAEATQPLVPDRQSPPATQLNEQGHFEVSFAFGPRPDLSFRCEISQNLSAWTLLPDTSVRWENEGTDQSQMICRFPELWDNGFMRLQIQLPAN